MNNKSKLICAFGVSIFISLVLACNFVTSMLPTNTPKTTSTPTLSPLEARAGVWHGTTSFGAFTFEVSPDGKEVIDFKLHYESLGGGLKGDVTLKDSKIPITEHGIFEISVPDLFVLTAQFSDDGTSATGHWEMIKPIKASESWKIKDHVPDFARLTPVLTQTISTLPPDQLFPNGVETQATKLEDIAGVWLEMFQGGSARLEIRPDGVTVFKIISGANKGYHDQGQYWFENGELRVKTEGIAEIGKYKVYVTRQDRKAIQIRYEVIEDSHDARRDAMIYAPLTLLETVGDTSPGSTSPPLEILGCNPVSECSESAVSIRSFFEENEILQYNTEYPVSVSTDADVRFFIGWCTLEEEILEENLEHIEFVFTVDDISFIDQFKPNTYTVQDQTDSTKLNYCHSVSGMVSGWQREQTYRIVFGIKYEETIFDGWDTYEPGNYTHIYIISVEP